MEITKTLLRNKFDDLLVAEVKRYGGIPHLSPEELAFREAIAEFLNPPSNESRDTSGI